MAGQDRSHGVAGRRRPRLAARRAGRWLTILAAIVVVVVPLRFGGPARAEGGVPGTLDPLFDTDGIAVNELLSHLGSVSDAERLPDGRILVLADGLVWRFFADGTLDTSWDGEGVLKPASSSLFTAYRMALRPGGGFVLTSGGGGYNPSCPTGHVAKFDANGVSESAFDGDGVVCIGGFPDFQGIFADVIVQPDDRIVALGTSQVAGAAAHVALVRLATNGSTDKTVVQALNSTFENGNDLVVQSDGKILVAGSGSNYPNYDDISVVLSRYLPDTLALDTAFGGGDGINVESVFLDTSRAPARLALSPDGTRIGVAVAGTTPASDDVDPDIPVIEQLLFDEDGSLADSPLDVEFPGRSSVYVNDLTATATGFVAVGHFSDLIAPTSQDGMVAISFGQTFTDVTALTVAHPSAALPSSSQSILLPDGKVLVVGRFDGPAGEQLVFNRLIEDGSGEPRTVALDPTIGTAFGQNGFRVLNAATADRGQAVAVQPDGKVLVGGLSRSVSAGPAGVIGGRGFVLRHNDDGSLDSGFGGPQRPGVAFFDFEVNGVAAAPDGRVVAVGTRFFPANGHGPHQPAAAQVLLADGTPDQTWNGGKPVFFTPGADLPGTFFNDVTVQPDGKVVVAGDYHACQTVECPGENFILVARFLSTGELDTTFSTDGYALVGPVTGHETELAKGRGVALAADGRVVVAGNLGATSGSNVSSMVAVARFEPDGDPDPTFAAPAGSFGPGVLADDLVPGVATEWAFATDVALRPDGRPVVSGTLHTWDCSASTNCSKRSTAFAAQYLAEGKRDTDFGTDGLAGIGPNFASGSGAAVDAAGNVLLAGDLAAANGPVPDILLARFTSSGTPDAVFGTGGRVLTDVNDQSDAGKGIALAPDGKILVAGTNTDTRGDRVVTARFEPGGALQCAPSPVDFGDVVLTTGAVSQAVTCTNVGPSRLTITGLTLTGTNVADFTPANGTCLTTLAPGQSCQASVAFDPGATGPRAASLTVAHSGQGNADPVAVALQGNGIPFDTTLRFDPAALAFGEQLGLRTTPAQTVTVTNTGTVRITINGVAVENDPTGEFTVVSSTCTGVTLAPGASCQVSVTYTPKVPGARSVALRFDDTALNAPHRLPMTGTGATPTLTLNPGLGHPGTVTLATGTKFPPNQTVTLTWVDPVTLLGGGFAEPAVSAQSNPDGTLTATVLVFPKSRIGTRTLLATVGNFTANAPFLATPGTLQGPDFVFRR